MTILPQLEQDLFRAAQRRIPQAGRVPGDSPGSVPAAAPPRRRLRRALAPLPVLAAGAVALAVAAGVLVTLGHRHRPPVSAGTAPASVQASRQRLIALLGVLRRPQTPADRRAPLLPGPLQLIGHPRNAQQRAQFAKVLARWGDPKLDSSLVRVVAIPQWKAQVALAPATYRPSQGSPRRQEGLEVTLSDRGSGETGSGPRPTSVAVVAARGLALTGGTPAGGAVHGVLVVPDGVARVTLSPVRVIDPPAPVDVARLGTITAIVHDNVAAYRFPIPRAVDRRISSSFYGAPAVAAETWYGADGRVIRQTTTPLDLFVQVRGKRRVLPPPIQRRQFCNKHPRAC